MKSPLLLAALFTLMAVNLGCAQITFTLEAAPKDASPAGISRGFKLTQKSFDESASMSDARRRENSGVVFTSFGPGNIWGGQRPGFIPETYAPPWGGPQLPNTDVFDDARFFYAHYGPDHYQTQLVVISDPKRGDVFLLDCRQVGDVSRVIFEPEAEVLYYTTLEGNLGDAEDAILHAFSTKKKAPLWRTASATAQGDLLVYERHILCHYGFTAQDDFINVIDRGSGEVLKKQRVKTAASSLILTDELIRVPCYQGVYEFSFAE